jgi:Flp pilus assembly protein TadG
MAVVAVPLMGAVGMTVDYSRVNGARAAFQVALDSAALMMSKDAPTKTNPERQTEAAKPSAPSSTGPKSPTLR